MKIFFKVVGILAVLAMVGCSNDENRNNNVDNNTFTKKGTLQGTIFDATTGARINDDSLDITLVQGTSYRSPNVLKKNESDTTFAGDYAFNDIPLSLAAGNNITYRVVATTDGYQQFEGFFSPSVNATGVNNTVDDKYNFVRNVYLFPLGAQANDVIVNVTYNGEAVSGATVQLQPSTNNNDVTAIAGNRLTAANGQLGSLSATTDDSGVATFAGTDLVLGGAYQIVVLPLVYQDAQLALTTGAGIIIGQDNKAQSVAMNDLEPGTANGLYIVSNSNADANNIQSNGVLTITFSRPVTLIDEPLINAALGGTVRSAALDVSGAGTSVTGSLSTDGLVLTLTPNFTTSPVAFDGTNGASAATPTADISLTVTYSNVFVTIADGNDGGTPYNVFTQLVGSSGAAISGTVLMTGPEDY
jgi:hypothetical protein